MRVTVTSGTRRVDLVLPGAVPVAELVPELARSVGLLDPVTVYGGYRLVTQEGRELAGDAGLIMQGIEDGGLLTVAAGVDDEPPRVYDDVVEAMTDVVERDLKPWEPASGRRTALSAAGLLMVLGAVALLHPGHAAGLDRRGGRVRRPRHRRDRPLPRPARARGGGRRRLDGLLLRRRRRAACSPRDGMLFGLPVAWAGAGALAAGLVALVGLGDGRTLVIPPVVVGAIFLATGLVMRAATFDPAVVLTTTLTLVVMVGSVFPWLALGATGTTVDQLYTTADITADPDEIDPTRVSADARVAHEILVAVSATVGLLLVLIAPLAVSLGVTGTVLAVMCCLVVMLRTRQYRTGTEVLVGLVSGILGLLSVGVSMLWLHPDWRPTAAVALSATGAVLLAVTLLPSTPSVRRGRFGDIAETVALLSLLPLLIIATGVFSAIRG